MIKINLSFKENPMELELYNWVKSKMSSSSYIKQLIKDDMERQKKIEELIKKGLIQ